jgi:hypothetical protein
MVFQKVFNEGPTPWFVCARRTLAAFETPSFFGLGLGSYPSATDTIRFCDFVWAVSVARATDTCDGYNLTLTNIKTNE